MADTSPAGPAGGTPDNNPKPATPATPGTPPAVTPVKKRRRRRWPWVVLFVLLCMLVGFALLPTVLSMGPAAAVADGQVNSRIQGKVKIGSVSVGWFSHATLHNLVLLGPRGHLVASIASVRTNLNIFSFLGNWHKLGRVDVHATQLRLVRQANGKWNLQNALASRTAAPQAQQAPAPQQQNPAPQQPASTSKPSVYQADLHLLADKISMRQGKAAPIQATGTKVHLAVDTSGATPLVLALQSQLQQQHGTGTVTAAGTLNAFNGGAMRPLGDITGTVNTNLENFPLATVNPFLAGSAHPLALSGVANGTLALQQKTPGRGSVNAHFLFGHLAAGGAALHGDTPRFGNVPLVAAASWTPQLVHVQQMTLRTRMFSLAMQGSAPAHFTGAAAALNAASLHLQARAALPALAKAFPNTLHLQKNVAVNAGQATLTAALAAAPAGSVATMQMAVEGVTGTASGKPIALQPLQATAQALLQQGGALLQHAQIIMQQPGAPATLQLVAQQTGAGGNYAAQFHCALASLNQQLAQFVKLKIHATGELSGSATLAQFDAPVGHFTVQLAGKNVQVSGVGAHPFQQRALSLQLVKGTIKRANGAIQAVNCTLQTNSDFVTIAPSPVELLRQPDGTFGGQTTLHIVRGSLAAIEQYLPPSLLTARKLRVAGDIGASTLRLAYGGGRVAFRPQLALQHVRVSSTDPARGGAVFDEPSITFQCSGSATTGSSMTGSISHVQLATGNQALALTVGKPISFAKSPAGMRFAAQYVHLGANLDMLRPLLLAAGTIKPTATLHGYATVDGSGSYGAKGMFAGFLAKVNNYQYIAPGAAQSIPPTNIAINAAGQVSTATKTFTATAPLTVTEQDPNTKAGESLVLDKGSHLSWAPGGAVNATGMLNYNLARLGALLGPYLPAGTTMSGVRKERFALSGHMGTGTGMAKLRPLVLKPLTLGFDHISTDGVNMGPGKLQLAMANGVAPISRLPIPANGGTLLPGGHIDFNQTPPQLVIAHPLQLATNVHINDQISAGPLSFLPISWGAKAGNKHLAAVHGLLNMNVTRAAIPLNSAAMKKTGTALATMSIKKLTANTPFLATIRSLAGPILGGNGNGLRLNNSGLRTTTITLQNGKISYKNLRLLMVSYGMDFTGTVGMDKSLDMQVNITGKGLTAALPLAMHGTVTQPKLALSGNALRQTVTQLPGLLQGINKLTHHNKKGTTGKPGKKKKNSVNSIINGLGGLLNQKKNGQ